MAARTARERTLPKRHNDRRAAFHSTARLYIVQRPVGPFMRVRLPDCEVDKLVGRGDTFAPGSDVVTVHPHGSPGSAGIVLGPPPGLAGFSQFSIDSQALDLSNPAVFASVPASIEAGKTTEVFLIGTNFLDVPVDTFTVVLPDSTDVDPLPDPLVSLGVVTFVPDPAAEGLEGIPADSTVVKVDITVDAAHVTGSTSDLAFLRYMVVRS